MDTNELPLPALQVREARTVTLKLLDEAGEPEDQARAASVPTMTIQSDASDAPVRLEAGGAAPQDSVNESSARSRAFRQRYYPDATEAQWNDWKWQLRYRI